MFSMTKELSKHMKSVADLSDEGAAEVKEKVPKVRAVSSGVKRKKTESNTEGTGSKKRTGGGGFNKLMRPSDELRIFLGLDVNEGIARTTCVKQFWNYIQANGLQNPSDRREILLDSRMQSVFGVKIVTMFSMNKYLANHLSAL